MIGNYRVVSGAVFGFVAAAQALRAFSRLPVHIGSFELPVWASWIAAAVAGCLCVWAFRGRH
jgi:hypothetical protein